MTVVQQVFINKIINFMSSEIQRGKVKVNGQFKEFTIYSTFHEGNTLRKYLYLEMGASLIEEAQLLSSDGTVLAKKPFSINKTEDGLILAFEFTISVEGV